eukprot:5314218-Prymnesium_polylepis.1
MSMPGGPPSLPVPHGEEDLSQSVVVLLATMPILVVVVGAFAVATCLHYSKPFWTDSEVEHLRNSWSKDDALVKDLRRVRPGAAGRHKLVERLLDEAEEAEHEFGMSRILAPSMIIALEPNIYIRWLMCEQLVLAYSMLTREQLAHCICSAFVSHTAEALLGAIDIVIHADQAAARFLATEPQLFAACHELSDA